MLIGTVTFSSDSNLSSSSKSKASSGNPNWSSSVRPKFESPRSSISKFGLMMPRSRFLRLEGVGLKNWFEGIWGSRMSSHVSVVVAEQTLSLWAVTKDSSDRRILGLVQPISFQLVNPAPRECARFIVWLTVKLWCRFLSPFKKLVVFRGLRLFPDSFTLLARFIGLEDNWTLSAHDVARDLSLIISWLSCLVLPSLLPWCVTFLLNFTVAALWNCFPAGRVTRLTRLSRFKQFANLLLLNLILLVSADSRNFSLAICCIVKSFCQNLTSFPLEKTFKCVSECQWWLISPTLFIWKTSSSPSTPSWMWLISGVFPGCFARGRVA